ncbi:MOSC domain-containing protein [Dyadobacter luticola]|uniref:MOSC domain-containing protein n=1 Tax=Dyadobacter luticola TaxID=1979387 RepID=A0A5R9L1F3_9BACT|nr:MOSC N-terminal beta barrel domain-containing protein [Dyadobacter luticola]TLV02241.1 MOSC domain-containing protein [Dyadobacter luticola]
MFLSQIWIYPVKSLGGIRVKEAQVEERGLQYDRRWMVVDENGKFLTQRVNANMALIQVGIEANNLTLKHSSHPEDRIEVPFHPDFREPVKVQVWKDTLTAYTVCEKVDVWLTKHLKKHVRLVEMTAASERKMPEEKAVNDESVSFADDFPYLLTSQSSLLDLNSKLSEQVEMKRFRPNFVIAGAEPFDEDTWNSIRIGNTCFEAMTLCERCIMINIDPETSRKDSEPLKTLASYRREGKKIFFGRNLIGTTYGAVREGDPVISHPM